ncbi:40s ribosomal protein s5-1 [Hordeum vulgare]|nr:40s ribosomal protein s5-1 [Hordeum vulgare]
METRLEAMEQQVFKCQWMVERGLNANHTMITEFTSNHKMDSIDIGKHLSRLYDRVDQLQGQIYDLQNQNCEYEYRFKSIREKGLGFILTVKFPTRDNKCHVHGLSLYHSKAQTKASKDVVSHYGVPLVHERSSDKSNDSAS